MTDVRLTKQVVEFLVVPATPKVALTKQVVEFLVIESDATGQPMSIGGQSIDKVYAGSTEISAIYVGDTKTFEAG